MFWDSEVKGKGLLLRSPAVSHEPEVSHLEFAPLLRDLQLPHFFCTAPCLLSHSATAPKGPPRMPPSPGRSHPSSCSLELVSLPHAVDLSPVVHLNATPSDVLEKKVC